MYSDRSYLYSTAGILSKGINKQHVPAAEAMGAAAVDTLGMRQQYLARTPLRAMAR